MAIDDGHALDTPVLGNCGQALVDLGAMGKHTIVEAARELLEFAVTKPAVQKGAYLLRFRRRNVVVLIQELKRHFPGAASFSHWQ